jgi:hypothetical protein
MPETYCLISDNIISLHTAVFRDDGYVATLNLTPRHQLEAAKIAWVFRRRLTFAKRIKRAFLGWNSTRWESHLCPDDIPAKPKVEFIWSDNGLSVAILIEKKPMAFIHETSRNGFSKCLKHAFGANVWDEDLFRKIFK